MYLLDTFSRAVVFCMLVLMLKMQSCDLAPLHSTMFRKNGWTGKDLESDNIQVPSRPPQDSGAKLPAFNILGFICSKWTTKLPNYIESIKLRDHIKSIELQKLIESITELQKAIESITELPKPSESFTELPKPNESINEVINPIESIKLRDHVEQIDKTLNAVDSNNNSQNLVIMTLEKALKTKPKTVAEILWNTKDQNIADLVADAILSDLSSHFMQIVHFNASAFANDKTGGTNKTYWHFRWRLPENSSLLKSYTDFPRKMSQKAMNIIINCLLRFIPDKIMFAKMFFLLCSIYMCWVCVLEGCGCWNVLDDETVIYDDSSKTLAETDNNAATIASNKRPTRDILTNDGSQHDLGKVDFTKVSFIIPNDTNNAETLPVKWRTSKESTNEAHPVYGVDDLPEDPGSVRNESIILITDIHPDATRNIRDDSSPVCTENVDPDDVSANGKRGDNVSILIEDKLYDDMNISTRHVDTNMNAELELYSTPAAHREIDDIVEKLETKRKRKVLARLSVSKITQLTTSSSISTIAEGRYYGLLTPHSNASTLPKKKKRQKKRREMNTKEKKGGSLHASLTPSRTNQLAASNGLISEDDKIKPKSDISTTHVGTDIVNSDYVSANGKRGDNDTEANGESQVQSGNSDLNFDLPKMMGIYLDDMSKNISETISKKIDEAIQEIKAIGISAMKDVVKNIRLGLEEDKSFLDEQFGNEGDEHNDSHVLRYEDKSKVTDNKDVIQTDKIMENNTVRSDSTKNLDITPEAQKTKTDISSKSSLVPIADEIATENRVTAEGLKTRKTTNGLSTYDDDELTKELETQSLPETSDELYISTATSRDVNKLTNEINSEDLTDKTTSKVALNSEEAILNNASKSRETANKTNSSSRSETNIETVMPTTGEGHVGFNSTPGIVATNNVEPITVTSPASDLQNVSSIALEATAEPKTEHLVSGYDEKHSDTAVNDTTDNNSRTSLEGLHTLKNTVKLPTDIGLLDQSRAEDIETIKDTSVEQLVSSIINSTKGIWDLDINMSKDIFNSLISFKEYFENLLTTYDGSTMVHVRIKRSNNVTSRNDMNVLLFGGNVLNHIHTNNKITYDISNAERIENITQSTEKKPEHADFKLWNESPNTGNANNIFGCLSYQSHFATVHVSIVRSSIGRPMCRSVELDYNRYIAEPDEYDNSMNFELTLPPPEVNTEGNSNGDKLPNESPDDIYKEDVGSADTNHLFEEILSSLIGLLILPAVFLYCICMLAGTICYMIFGPQSSKTMSVVPPEDDDAQGPEHGRSLTFGDVRRRSLTRT